MPQAEFQYGSDEQGFKLTGTAEFRFGAKPRFDGVLSGRQIDVDRSLADSGQPQPVIVLRNLAGLAAAAFRPTIPVQLGVGIDRVTLGGGTIENLRGDLSSDAGGWSLDRFEFRAPGFTQVRLSGELATDAAGASFKGPTEIEAGDPKAFAAWLEGRAAPEQGELRPLHLRGDVAFSGEQLSVARLTAEFDRKSVTGNISYVFAGSKPARLDADLAAQELDIDALFAFGKALVAGSDIERPRDIAINATIGHARYAGLEARDAVVRVKAGASGLQIDRLSIGDLGGNSFTASGRIDTSIAMPRGSLTLDLDIKRPDAIAPLIGQAWPVAAFAPSAIVDRVGHAKLHATLDVSGDKGTNARVVLTGDVDAMKLDASLSADGDWKTPSTARLKLAAALKGPDGNKLLQLAGLDGLASGNKTPGTLSIDIAGDASGALSGSWHLAAGGVDLASQLTLDGRRIALNGIDAKFGGSTIHGRITLGDQAPRRVEGALEADGIDATTLLAAAIGMPAPVAATNGGWTVPVGPFTGGVIGDLTGDVVLKAQHVAVGPQLAVTSFGANMQFLSGAITFDAISGDLAGGHYNGRLGLRSDERGVHALLHSSLRGAHAADLLKGSSRPPVTGSVDVDGDVEGAGFSIAALVGSLHGTEKIVLSNGEFAGLDSRVFDSATRSVDQGLAVDASHVAAAVNRSFDGGHFTVKRADAVVAIGNGQARLNELRLTEDNTELLAGGTLDLATGVLDGRLTLLGTGQKSRERPYIVIDVKGPLGAPERTVDSSGLTAWLTLRSVDNESRRLKAMEQTTQSAPPAAPRAPAGKKEAPALPAPLEIKPAPQPRQVPEASVSPHH
jgi:large subunit ribosomal protein L24